MFNEITCKSMPTLIFKETEACNSNCIYCDVIARKKPKTITEDLLDLVFVNIKKEKRKPTVIFRRLKKIFYQNKSFSLSKKDFLSE